MATPITIGFFSHMEKIALDAKPLGSGDAAAGMDTKTPKQPAPVNNSNTAIAGGSSMTPVAAKPKTPSGANYMDATIDTLKDSSVLGIPNPFGRFIGRRLDAWRTNKINSGIAEQTKTPEQAAFAKQYAAQNFGQSAPNLSSMEAVTPELKSLGNLTSNQQTAFGWNAGGGIKTMGGGINNADDLNKHMASNPEVLKNVNQQTALLAHRPKEQLENMETKGRTLNFVKDNKDLLGMGALGLGGIAALLSGGGNSPQQPAGPGLPPEMRGTVEEDPYAIKNFNYRSYE